MSETLTSAINDAIDHIRTVRRVLQHDDADVTSKDLVLLDQAIEHLTLVHARHLDPWPPK